MKKVLVLLMLGILGNSAFCTSDNARFKPLSKMTGNEIVQAHKEAIQTALTEAKALREAFSTYKNSKGWMALDGKYDYYIRSLLKDQKKINSKSPKAVAARAINKKLRWPVLKNYAQFLISKMQSLYDIEIYKAKLSLEKARDRNKIKVIPSLMDAVSKQKSDKSQFDKHVAKVLSNKELKKDKRYEEVINFISPEDTSGFSQYKGVS